MVVLVIVLLIVIIVVAVKRSRCRHSRLQQKAPKGNVASKVAQYEKARKVILVPVIGVYQPQL